MDRYEVLGKICMRGVRVETEGSQTQPGQGSELRYIHTYLPTMPTYLHTLGTYVGSKGVPIGIF